MVAKQLLPEAASSGPGVDGWREILQPQLLDSRCSRRS
jgi:hypothetical protein